MSDSTPKLTAKQRRFIDEYLRCWNATEAAQRAGYKGSKTTLATVGYENLNKPYIRAVIEKYLPNEVDKVPRFNGVRKSPSNFLYLIRAENGLIKIGITSDVQRRLATLNTMCPVDLDLLFAIQMPKAPAVEFELHQLFADRRVKGEWFGLTDDDVNWVIENYGKAHN